MFLKATLGTQIMRCCGNSSKESCTYEMRFNSTQSEIMMISQHDMQIAEIWDENKTKSAIIVFGK